MNWFEYIRLLMFAMPLGIFFTFGLLVLVALTIKHIKLEVTLKYLLFYYCLSASVAGFLQLAYYYHPQLFSWFDIIYGAAVIFAIVLFHHLLCFMIRFEKPFNKWHYFTALFTCIAMLVSKLFFPVLWKEEGIRIVLTTSLLFGTVHSLLTLIRVHHHQLELSLEYHTAETIDKGKTIPFILEVLLFPWTFAACPLLTGQNPGIFTSLVLMGSIALALRMNIPLTYAMIRHYATPFNEMSLLAIEDISKPDVPFENGYTTTIATPKRVYRKLSDSHLPKGVKTRLDRRKFERYIKTNKPYLDPGLTIQELATLLESNRTYLSGFINRTYNMNFSSYLNHCRLAEMRRLLQHPENRESSSYLVYKEAGFASHRNYLRAKRIEEERKKEKPNKTI